MRHACIVCQEQSEAPTAGPLQAAEPIADDDDRLLGSLLVRRERAALRGAHAEQREDGG
jgi:hypothetical protein